MADSTTLNDPRQGRGYKPPASNPAALGQALGTTKTPFSSAPGRKVNAPVSPVAPAPAVASAAAAELAPTSTAKDNLLNYDELKNMSNDELSARAYKLSQSQNPEDVENAAILVGLQKSKAEKEYGDLQTKKEVETARKTAENALDNANKQRTLFDKQKDILNGEYGHFAPTRETATDIMGLFSMLSIAAMGAGNTGKYYGMNAMAALSGAMKGYKEGRDDVYKKEMTEYEKNLAAFNKHQENLLKGVQLARDMQSIDKDAAAAQFAAVIAQDTGGMGALKGRIGDYASQQKIYETNAKIRREMKKAADELQRKKDESALRDKEKKEDQRIREDRNAELEREAGARESRLLTAIGEKGDLVTLKDGTLARVVGNKIVPIEGGAGATKLGTPAKNAADDVASYLSSKGINISDKKDRAAVQSAVDAYSTLQSLKDLVSDDPNLVGRQGQIRQFTDKYYKSFKGEGPAVNESDVKQDDQAALRFAKTYASMLTRYERALADGGRSGSTVSFQNRYNDLLSQNQFNPAGLAALMNDMQDEMTKMARVKSPKISHSMMEEMATEFGAGLQATPSKAAPAAGGATEKLPPNPDRHFIGTEPIIPNKDNTGWIYEKTGKAVK